LFWFELASLITSPSCIFRPSCNTNPTITTLLHGYMAAWCCVRFWNL
jgi:hypothetical protein